MQQQHDATARASGGARVLAHLVNGETGGDGWQPMYGERGGGEGGGEGVMRDAQDCGERGTEKERGGEEGAPPPSLPERGCETSLHYVVW